ncbi:MAG: twin-arginine translocase subunit TatC [Candidatus Paceibacterota bacterium]|jgi:sec-independent protein translocase protein TatC
MTILEELKIFAKHIIHWVYYFVGFSFFFFVFGLHKAVIFGKTFLFLLPSEDSIAVQVFNRVREDVLPKNVELLVTNPMSGFLSQMSLAIFLAFLATLPLFVYKVTLYLRPALLPHERKVLSWMLWPTVFLFFSGCAFSYFFLVPATFSVLYPFATRIGATTFFSLDEFIYYVFSLTFYVGIMFLLPLFMIMLSMMGIVKAEIWLRIWRHAILLFLVLAASITPDGTGITMAMLFVPLASLYFTGYYFAKRLTKGV